MTKSCRQCTQAFDITDSDLEFYDKVSPTFGGKKELIPPPTLCPQCRAIRRLAFRNERKLYNDACDSCGKDILSVYSPDKPYVVYCPDCWWSDRFDPLQYGREFDFTKTFTEQFDALLKRTPTLCLEGSDNENCPYNNLIANCKNCHLIFECSNDEDCYYGYWLQKCLACMDTAYVHECQYCFEVQNCYSCYRLFWSKDCMNCSDSMFLDDCIGCRDCFGCSGLRQKQYCVFNEQKTKEEYETFRAAFDSGSHEAVERMKEKAREVALTMPKKYVHSVQAENCTGDYIVSAKNCSDCYHVHDAEECKYGEHVWRNSKFNMDVSTVGRDAELVYEAINTCISVYNVRFAYETYGSSNMTYSLLCAYSKDCFGCTCLKKHQYCILNKQYSQKEYEALVPKIIEHMRKDGGEAMNPAPSGAGRSPSEVSGSWGEFFDPRLSPWGYNETTAQDQYPLSREEALKKGFTWSDYVSPPPIVSKVVPAAKLPDHIKQIPNEILSWAIECEVSGKPFSIIKQELKFLRENNLPFPRRHPDIRHLDRMATRNPNKLYDRTCAKCAKVIRSSYAPDKFEKVYCEECYLKEVY